MNPAKILVADDEEFVAQILKVNLQRRGYEVILASDGEAAFRAVLEHRPDLLVSDFQMPILDGFSLSLRLKQHPQTASVPVLMLTARGHFLDPADLARTNIRRLLSKPFSTNQLIATIQQTLNDVSHIRRQAV